MVEVMAGCWYGPYGLQSAMSERAIFAALSNVLSRDSSGDKWQDGERIWQSTPEEYDAETMLHRPILQPEGVSEDVPCNARALSTTAPSRMAFKVQF